jgi:hypothetical protein
MFRSIYLAILILASTGLPASAEEFLPVRNPQHLPAQLPVTRTPIGIAGDYKPCLVSLPGGELLLVAFHQVKLEGKEYGPLREDVIFYRSTDNGQSWSERETTKLVGREPYFSMTSKGTLFITGHVLAREVRNEHDYLFSCLHRSTDGGRTWETLPIHATDLPGAPEKEWTHTSRGVCELQDGTLILGVSTKGGYDYLWRSSDDGKTWDRSLKCTLEGLDTSKLWWPVYAETVFWQAPSGDLLALFRMDPKVLPSLSGHSIPENESDQSERLIVLRSTDGGANWKFDKPLGSFYGEMYPAIMRIDDRRLLLTFTVRAERKPLGVHAVFGKETPQGFEFNFDHDRVVIDAKTPVDQGIFGGFGPTVRLEGGALATAYSYRGADGKTRVEVATWLLP